MSFRFKFLFRPNFTHEINEILSLFGISFFVFLVEWFPTSLNNFPDLSFTVATYISNKTKMGILNELSLE